jgi:excisionase family DNA binding protein
MTTQPLLTRKELCKLLQCSVPTLKRMERLGRLRAIRLGNCTVRYTHADVESLIQESTKRDVDISI